MEADTDWRLQAVTELSKDWRSPWSGELHKKGAKVISVSISQLNKKKTLTIPIPNATASCLNISKCAWDESRRLRKNAKLDSSLKQEVSFRTEEEAIDYIEALMQSIVFAFTALEAFVNEFIPHDYKYVKHGQKSTEKYTKAEIERWIQIDEKLGKVLPEIFGVETPKGKHKSWNEFQKLKEIRDRLIHMKTADRRSAGPEDKTIWNELVKAEPPYSEAFSIIEYFVNKMDKKPSWYDRGRNKLNK